MLRRKPTAITITQEDINTFEEARSRENASKNNNNNQDYHSGFSAEADNRSQNAGGGIDPNDELKPLPGDKARIIRSREERIGLGGR